MNRFNLRRVRRVRALFAAACIATSGSVLASDFDEDVLGDLSNDHLAPTVLMLGPDGSHAVAGSNVVTGRIGRANGVIDRDYLNFIVPDGYVLKELKVGQQTTFGNQGSFIGLAAGAVMTDPERTPDASALLGYHIYGSADRGQDILDDMAAAIGTVGFSAPLAAGSYTLWIQETSNGAFRYRMNLVLAPVPEADRAVLLLSGLMLTALVVRRRRI
ncbi:hypothetical protein NMQ14_02110 [Methyloversatilis sp. XJ19-13]|uniref:hypothetical protein n=1 Tax=Methyloversatilis sp. XJ19-13 TaxID=2963430 RepID=UPI00211CB351|nr:hypothetical protein [Methyloversatilis sp. XJ19-13]MCQ9373040.1 hypothetical protein [Methyloversatilis sp. XJ19-13]